MYILIVCSRVLRGLWRSKCIEGAVYRISAVYFERFIALNWTLTRSYYIVRYQDETF
jgi:hypothetical protein